MSETIDPITWLRDQTMSNRQIAVNHKTNQLQVDNSQISIPKDAPTAWKRKDGKGYYSIGSLWLMLKMREGKQGDYVREAVTQGIPQVIFGDKKEVTEYFTGSVNESAQIDTSKRASTLVSKSGTEGETSLRKRDVKAEQKQGEQAQKALKDGKEMTISDYLAANEKAISSRATAIRCRKKNFLKVLQLGYQLVQKFDDAEKIKERIEQRGAIAKDVNLDVQIFKPQQRLNLLETILNGGRTSRPSNDFSTAFRPVIIVPGMLVPGNLSLTNIKQFLEDGVYDENPSEAGISSLAASPVVQVTRKIANKTVTFDVYDSVTNFTDSRWQRVVAVFVNGQDWQFREWKNGSEKRELFARVRGYYVHFANTQIPQVISNWNIKRLELQRNKRHHDINIRNNMWSDLEEFLRREKFQGCDF